MDGPDSAQAGTQRLRALVLSGGVALGAFEAGAYAALEEAGEPAPDMLVGCSVGAVNAAIIAGNPPGARAAALRRFWKLMATDPTPATTFLLGPPPSSGAWRAAYNEASALQTLLFGHPRMFRPRLAPGPRVGQAPAMFDLEPLLARLPDFIDFDRLNGGDERLIFATTDVETGKRVVFDTAAGTRIGPRHVVASYALLPVFAPVELDGRLLADGGLASNAPLDLVLDAPRDRATDCILIEHFARPGSRPRTLGASIARAADLGFGNQTQRILEGWAREQRLRSLVERLVTRLPQALRADAEVASLLAEARREPPLTLVRIGYRGAWDEAGPEKLFDYSAATLADRWAAGGGRRGDAAGAATAALARHGRHPGRGAAAAARGRGYTSSGIAPGRRNPGRFAALGAVLPRISHAPPARMTLDQALAFGILAGTVGLFLWGRLPYDLVAMLSLLAGILTGIVPMHDAFGGFSDDIVIIVTAALVVSAAVARSGAVETAMRPLLPHLQTLRTQVPVLAAAVMLASVFTKNIGALAIFMPVALQLARRTGTPPGALLMPMAFASLLGGLVTLIGTSPNIIVSRVREQVTGQPFGMFDYAPVGLAIALAGLVFLALGWRLLPAARRGKVAQPATAIDAYATEVRLPPESPIVGETVGALQALSEDRVDVATLLREGLRREAPPMSWTLRADDLLILEGEPEDLEALVARAKLTLVGEKNTAEDVPEDAKTVVEGVIASDSPLVGATPTSAALAARFGISLLAVSRRGERIRERLKRLKLRRGDVAILKGEAERLPDILTALRILPLTERGIPLGRSRRSWLPAIVLGLAMLAVATHAVPVTIAFFAAAVAMLLLRTLTPQEAYQAVDWPVIILLGALIPVSEAIRTTGGTELIAGWLSSSMDKLPPLGALGLIMVVAMAVTPFLNNAATVLMLGPIAGSLAQRLGLSPDPFLMAVAVGAACDFLTPIGHQCNTLVMGPGGYRFGDYWRLGLPLSIIVLVVGVPMIALVWPLAR